MPGSTQAKEEKNKVAEDKEKTDCSYCLPLPNDEGHLDMRSIQCGGYTQIAPNKYVSCTKMVVPDGVSREGYLSCADHRDGDNSIGSSGMPWQDIKKPNSNCAMDPKVMEKRAALAERVLPYVTARAQFFEGKLRRWLKRISVMNEHAKSETKLEIQLLNHARKGVILPKYDLQISEDDSQDHDTFNPS
jgi:hypothetical protein